jgi:mRNA interferase MazF
VRRGEIWLADVGRKPRPVLVVTRDEVLDVRANVTVVEITTQARGITVEVPIGTDTGLRQHSVANCEGLRTVSQRSLTSRLGSVDDDTLDATCAALAVALGCDRD